MSGKKVKFEGKIKLQEAVSAKNLVSLLNYLSDDLGFTLKQIKEDEIKMIKNDFVKEQEGGVEITTSEAQIEIEIEVSDNKFEVEIESENLDLVKELTSKISEKL